jgi:hypothetical protein
LVEDNSTAEIIVRTASHSMEGAKKKRRLGALVDCGESIWRKSVSNFGEYGQLDATQEARICSCDV